MVFLRAACIAALLALVSCWTPVFNQDLSVAELVRSKLKLERDFTTTLNNSGNMTGYFVQAGVSFDGNTQVVLSSNTNQVNVAWDSTNNNNSVQLDKSLADSTQVMIQPDLSDVNWYIPTLINGNGGSGDVRDVTSTGNSNTYSSAFSNNLTGSVLGFSTTEAGPTTVTGYYLVQSSPGSAQLWSLTTGSSSPIAVFTPAVAYSGTAGWMAVDPVGDANGVVVYLTHAPDSSGKYVTDKLDPQHLVISWSGKDHVAGFLSTSRLLTREGSFYNVCDVNGKILYSFPAGTLQFTGEYLDSLTLNMRVRFAEAIVTTPQNGGQDTVRVRIYSIATSKLDSLQQ